MRGVTDMAAWCVYIQIYCLLLYYYSQLRWTVVFLSEELYVGINSILITTLWESTIPSFYMSDKAPFSCVWWGPPRETHPLRRQGDRRGYICMRTTPLGWMDLVSWVSLRGSTKSPSHQDVECTQVTFLSYFLFLYFFHYVEDFFTIMDCLLIMYCYKQFTNWLRVKTNLRFKRFLLTDHAYGHLKPYR